MLKGLPVEAKQRRQQQSGRRHQARELYAAGMSSTIYEGRNLLIASPEKAVLDTLAWARINTKASSQKDIFEYACESLRIEAQDIMKLSSQRLKKLGPLYRMRAPQMFTDEVILRKKGSTK